MKNDSILLINGPNLNLLGTREPTIYGDVRLEQVEAEVGEFFEAHGFRLTSFQSNHEGELIDFIQAEGPGAKYALINLGALTHTSIALRDVIKGVGLLFIEIHISNIHAREPFRSHSYLSDIAQGVMVGLGAGGYLLAARAILDRLKS